MIFYYIILIINLYQRQRYSLSKFEINIIKQIIGINTKQIKQNTMDKLTNQEVLRLLNEETKTWLSTMQPSNFAHLLNSICKIPQFINITTATSANIGKAGELKFEELCKKLPCNYTIQNTAKIGHAGDFIITFTNNGREYKCLIDIKNYKNKIPKKEIDKFIYDLTYGSYDSGLLVSLNSKFTGIAESLHLTNHTTPYGEVPIMFVSEAPDDLLLKCVQLICLKSMVNIDKQCNADLISVSINNINQALQHSASTRRMLSDMQSTLSSQINMCQEQLIGGEVRIKDSIRYLEYQLSTIQINTNDPFGDNPFSTFGGNTATTTNAFGQTDNTTTIISTTTNDTTDAFNEGKTNKTPPDNLQQFKLSYYKYSDYPLINQLLDFKWDKIEQDKEKGNGVLTSKSVIIYINPFKTKTNITINKNDNLMPDVLAPLFTERKKYYTATLSQDIINNLYKVLSIN